MVPPIFDRTLLSNELLVERGAFRAFALLNMLFRIFFLLRVSFVSQVAADRRKYMTVKYLERRCTADAVYIGPAFVANGGQLYPLPPPWGHRLHETPRLRL